MEEGDSDDGEQKFEEITNKKEEGYKIQAHLGLGIGQREYISKPVLVLPSPFWSSFKSMCIYQHQQNFDKKFCSSVFRY